MHRDRDTVQRGVRRDRRGGEGIDLGGEHAAAAPALAAAIATSPVPAPKSSTERPATIVGMIEEVAGERLPAGPGEGPVGRRHDRCAKLSSVACQIGVISVARWRRISGTSGGAASAVLRANEDRGVHKADQRSPISQSGRR